nr:MAG TPA: HNH endonuclease bacteriophage, HNH Endonuclease, DNA.52A [Caudoviricetes sp.]
MLMRICSACGRQVRVGESCSCLKERQKSYDRDNRNKKAASLYHSRPWQLLQLAVKSRAQYIDEYVMYYEKRMTAGRIAHHIIPVDERPDLALNPQNLVYVSDKTHKLIHDAYKRGGKEKAAMQARLARIRMKKPADG